MASEDRNVKFWGFDPHKFTADIVNCVEDYFCDGCDHLEKVMVAHNAATKAKASKLAAGIDLLCDNTHKIIEKNTAVLQSYILKNLLTVSDDLVLPEDEDQNAESSADADETALDEQIRALTASVREAKYERVALLQARRQLRGERGIYEKLVTEAAGKDDVKEAEKSVFGAEDPEVVSTVREVISKARIYVQETGRLKQAVSQRPDLVVGMGLETTSTESFMGHTNLGIPDTEDMLLQGFEG